ncbi:MAG TPA: NTP transferase domain-containing protein [Gaiellaceae bacterium]|jgi:2-phospho-L-lactate guanylyltransferase (CobY/MobA/RfbA family)
MPSLVVPFRGAKGKSRLGPIPGSTRELLACAMLEDVVAACTAVGPTYVVAPAGTHAEDATLVPDPGGGQGAAVRAGLEVAALAAGGSGTLLVVNADLACVTPRDLLSLAGAVPPDGLAYAAAADGTTNALGLSSPQLFAPVFGPGSAARFGALGPSRRVDAPNLMDDVDTISDLERLGPRLGRRTRSILASLRIGIDFGAAA